MYEPKPFAVGVEPDLGLQALQECLPLPRDRLLRPLESDVAESLLLGVAIRAAALVTIESHAVVIVPHDRGNRLALNAIDDLIRERRIAHQIAQAGHRLHVLLAQVVQPRAVMFP